MLDLNTALYRENLTSWSSQLLNTVYYEINIKNLSLIAISYTYFCMLGASLCSIDAKNTFVRCFCPILSLA